MQSLCQALCSSALAIISINFSFFATGNNNIIEINVIDNENRRINIKSKFIKQSYPTTSLKMIYD